MFDYDDQLMTNTDATVMGWGGIAQDHSGLIWVGNGLGEDGIAAIDPDTLEVVDTMEFPTNDREVKGISVDVDGYVWAVRYADTHAYRLDPETHEVESYDGLDNPYTYSDMTGGMINQVTCNPSRRDDQAWTRETRPPSPISVRRHRPSLAGSAPGPRDP